MFTSHIAAVFAAPPSSFSFSARTSPTNASGITTSASASRENIIVARAYEAAELVLQRGYRLVAAVEGTAAPNSTPSFAAFTQAAAPNSTPGFAAFTQVGGVIIVPASANASACTVRGARIVTATRRSVSGHFAQLDVLARSAVPGAVEYLAVDEVGQSPEVVRRVADGEAACGFLRSDDFAAIVSGNTTTFDVPAVAVVPPQSTSLSVTASPFATSTPLYPDWSVVVSPEVLAIDGAPALLGDALLMYRGSAPLRFSRALDYTPVFELLWRTGAIPRPAADADKSGDSAVGLAIGLSGAGVIGILVVAAIVYKATRTRHGRGNYPQHVEAAYGNRDQRFAPTDASAPVTIVFTDIQASTMLWSAAPTEMGFAIDAHHAMVRELLQRHQGYEVKTIGDSFMCAFKSPTDAVEFALALQEELHAPGVFDRVIDELYADDVAERAFLAMEAYGQLHQHRTRRLANATGNDAEKSHTTAEAERYAARAAQCQRVFDQHAAGHDALEYNSGGWRGLRVRIGIHIGKAEIKLDPTTGGYDFYGTVVNTAARVESVAHGGQILVTPDVLAALGPNASAQQLAHADAREDRLGVSLDIKDLDVGVRKAAAAAIGAHALAGIAEPVPMVQLLPEALAARRFLPLRTRATERDLAAARVELDSSRDPASISGPEPQTDSALPMRAVSFAPSQKVPEATDRPTLPVFAFESSVASENSVRLPRPSHSPQEQPQHMNTPNNAGGLLMSPSLFGGKLCMSANASANPMVDTATDDEQSADESPFATPHALRPLASQLARSGNSRSSDRLMTLQSGLNRLLAPLPADAKDAFLRAVMLAWRVDAPPNGTKPDDALLGVALHRATAGGLDRRRATHFRRPLPRVQSTLSPTQPAADVAAERNRIPAAAVA